MLKIFLLWFLVAGTLYAAVGGGLHLYLSSEPERILVAVDSSYAMKAKWPAVVELLERLDTKNRYTHFALITEKRSVHSWQPDLSLGNTRAYGPRRLQRLMEQDVFFSQQTADERILITSQSPGTEDLRKAGWDIILLPW